MTEELKQENTPEVPETQEAKPHVNSEENEANWKKFREEREKDRQAMKEAQERARRKEEEAEALQKAMDALLNKNQPQTNYGYQEPVEDEVEKKIAEALEKERKRQEDQRRQEEIKRVPQMLQSNHPDFYEVCSQENMDRFEYENPKLAKALAAAPDTYDKWEAVYDAIKKNINYKDIKSDQARMDRNALKPQASPNIADNKPTGNPHRLTEEQRMANWRRMQQDMKSF